MSNVSRGSHFCSSLESVGVVRLSSSTTLMKTSDSTIPTSASSQTTGDIGVRFRRTRSSRKFAAKSRIDVGLEIGGSQRKRGRHDDCVSVRESLVIKLVSSDVDVVLGVQVGVEKADVSSRSIGIEHNRPAVPS